MLTALLGFNSGIRLSWYVRLVPVFVGWYWHVSLSLSKPAVQGLNGIVTYLGAVPSSAKSHLDFRLFEDFGLAASEKAKSRWSASGARDVL